MIVYNKLFSYLALRGRSITFLYYAGLSSKTVAKLRKNAPLSTSTIETICAFLGCQPGDIMSYVPDDKVRNFWK